METPALEHLLGAYFHQDWDSDGTEAEVLALFISDEPDLAARLPHEVGSVLSSTAPEDLESVLREKGSYYMGDRELGGARGFLERIAERARGG
jgi:hypothetical protein